MIFTEAEGKYISIWLTLVRLEYSTQGGFRTTQDLVLGVRPNGFRLELKRQ